MPRFDRTGPSGQGPTTGRGMGKCRQNDDSKDVNTEERGFFGRTFGFGFGRRNQGQGRGRGLGFRNK